MASSYSANAYPLYGFYRKSNAIIEVVVDGFPFILMDNLVVVSGDMVGIGNACGLIAVSYQWGNIEPRKYGYLITCIDGKGSMVMPIRHAYYF